MKPLIITIITALLMSACGTSYQSPLSSIKVHGDSITVERYVADSASYRWPPSSGGITNEVER